MDNIIGRKLDGRYEIKEIIGIGGMAVVYKAYDSIDDRIVAVKVLKEEYLKNDDFRRRFKNESKAVAVLSHPNIVKVYDVSFGDRIQYIVMEYIDGITLKEYIEQQKTLTWKEAVHFTVQILRALSHAHERGIVHRDIKPQNIMMLEDGTIKVTDFGIARFAHSETKTMTDKAIGSVHYISPEQARGSITDAKSDIYSVGVMLFEMLTGDLPFEADSAVSVAIMQMQEEPRKPRQLNPDIPEGLEEITLRAMQKNPEQRYSSAAEMLDDIERFKHNPSIHFQYKYFVDDSPTKYVEAIKEVRGTYTDAEDEAAMDKKFVKGKTAAATATKKTNLLPMLAGIAAALVVVVVALVIVALAMSGSLSPHIGDTTVPDLKGKVFSAVVKQYKGKLTITQSNTEYNSKIAAGKIISSDPAANTSVKKNASVTVVVSLGAQKFTIPTTLDADDEEQAKTDLVNAGFDSTKIVFQNENSDTVATGTVTRSLPAEGTQAASDAKITVYISLGPKLYPVPNVVNETSDQAVIDLKAAGFNNYVIHNETNNSYKKGYVCKTDPDHSQSVALDTTINIYVSLGPSASSTITTTTTAVPYVVNESLSKAQSDLKQYGLKPAIRQWQYDDNVPKNCVISQNPTYPQSIPKNTYVYLVVSKGPEPTSSDTSSYDDTSSIQ